MNISPSHIPQHVAIIMDGNGRWAKARGLPRSLGHKAGIDAVKRTLDAARDYGVKIITLYSFSTENWRRPAEEVGELMQLLRFYLQAELAKLHQQGVRLRVIGQRELLPTDIRTQIAEAEQLTAANQAFTLVIALSYGAQQEITQAAQKLAQAVQQGQLTPEQISERLFAQALYTADIPPPDLLIRTSGEQRLSNFLLWQLAYAELYFTPTYWPDFGSKDFAAALADYAQRERRYGAVAAKQEQPA